VVEAGRCDLVPVAGLSGAEQRGAEGVALAGATPSSAGTRTASPIEVGSTTVQ